MRKFIKIVTIFLFSAFAFIVSISFSLDLVVKQKGSFEILKRPKNVVFGHSHPECAFNDSIIESFTNLGHSGEAFFTHSKTVKILEQNPSIKNVFIEFSNNQITSKMDSWIQREGFVAHMYPIYGPYLTVGEKLHLLKANPLGFLTATSLSLGDNIERILKNHYSYDKQIGGFMSLKRDKTDSLIIAYSQQKMKRQDLKISLVNIEYLSKMIAVCKKHKKNVLLIRSPIHNRSQELQNESEFQKTRNKYFSNITWIDFSHFPLENSDFGDLEHLNHKGARKFSTWFNQLLEQKIISQDTKQETIDHEINKYKLVNNFTLTN